MACIQTEHLNTYQNRVDFRDHPHLGEKGCLDSNDSIVVKEPFQVWFNPGHGFVYEGESRYYLQDQQLKPSDPFVKYYISPPAAKVDFDRLNQDQNVNFIDQEGFREGVLDETDVIQVKRDFQYEQSNGKVRHYSEGEVLDIRDPYVRSTLFLLNSYIIFNEQSYYESFLDNNPDDSWQRLNLLGRIYDVQFYLNRCGNDSYVAKPRSERFYKKSSPYAIRKEQIEDYTPPQETNVESHPGPPQNTHGAMPPPQRPYIITTDDTFYGRTWVVERADQNFGSVSLVNEKSGSLQCEPWFHKNPFDEHNFIEISAEVYALLNEENGFENPEIIMSSEISETLFSEQNYEMVGMVISSSSNRRILLTQKHVRRIEFLDYDSETRELTVKLTHYPHNDAFITKEIIKLPE